MAEGEKEKSLAGTGRGFRDVRKLKRVGCLNCLWNKLLIQDNVHGYITAADGGSQCRVALLILDFLFLFLEYFRGFAEKLHRKLFMETVRPPCKTHNKRLFLILSGPDQTVQVTHHLRHSLITVTWYRSLLKLCRAMETLPL